MVTFRSMTTLVTQNDVQKSLSTRSTTENICLVKLKILNLRWLYQDGKWFGDVVKMFKELGRETWFGHEFL